VNGDKVPMAPGFGQQPRFIVTIQPVGTTFNPPAAMTLPNVDGLAPKSVIEMYSYDHDLSMFLAIGTGTVSSDGSTITSDPGVGVVKAGWHCGGDPNTTGSAGTCPVCQTCTGDSCNTDPAQDMKACTTPQVPSGTCKMGMCVGMPKVKITQPASGQMMTYYITGDNPPQMPTINAQAAVQGVTPDPTAMTTFNWTVATNLGAGECPHGPSSAVQASFMQSVTGGRFTPMFPNLQGGDRCSQSRPP